MSTKTQNTLNSPLTKKLHFDLFYPLRRSVNNIEVTDDKFAHFLCSLIPCSCPFERDITILGKTWHIPALCKLNPLYNEVVSLRLRALSYLEKDCGKDITQYIC
jgi:hypothetical protein